MRPSGRWSLPVRQGRVWMEWVYLLEFPVCTLRRLLYKMGFRKEV